MNNCDFCDQSTLEKQVIYGGSKISVLYPRSPVIREHFMIIPVRHVETLWELGEEELLECVKIINKIYGAFEKHECASGFNLFTNVGKKAGQHVSHFHWNLFIRFDDEKVSPYKILNNPKLKEEISPAKWNKRKMKISILLRDR